MTEKWEQMELPFDSGPRITPPGLLKKVRDVTVDRPTYRAGFSVFVDHDGEFIVKVMYPTSADTPIGVNVECVANPTEIERAARAVSDYERERILVERIAQRLAPRDLTQDSLRKKAKDRGVI